MKKNGIIFSSTLMMMCLLTAIALAADVSPAQANVDKFGFLTLLPPIVAITLAFLTRNVTLSLVLGVYAGAVLLKFDGNVFLAVVKGFLLFIEKIRDSLASRWNAGIILQCLTIGGLIALISKTGGLKAVAEKLAKKAKTARGAQLIAWFLGLIVFFDDYANALVVGPVMRPVTDKLKVSREKLSFIVDATAAPVAGIALISTWIGYEISLIKDAYMSIGQDVNSYGIFVSTIPFRFYNILMLLFIPISILLLKDFGPMLKAERRTRQTGKPYSDTAQPMMSEEITRLEPASGIKLNMWNAIVPITVLVIMTFLGFYYSGYKAIINGTNVDLINLIHSSPLSLTTIREILGKSDASVVLFQAALISCVVTMIMGINQKIFKLGEAITVWMKGMQALVITCIILLLAWSLSSVIKELGTAKYLVAMVSGAVPEFLLPALIFVTGSIISFATGTSYGTMGILMPLAVPLAFAISPEPGYLVLNVGAVLTGAIFGDHCSPISDTTILSAMGSTCDLMDHTNTQLLYAVCVAVIAALFGYIPVGLGMPVCVALIVSTLVTFLLVYFVGKKVED